MRFLPLVLAALLCGCFRYVETPGERPAPGAQIRIELGEAGRERMRALTGRERNHLEGTLVRREASGFVISSPLPASAGAVPARGLEERFEILAEDVASVRVRELDRVRTGMLVLGLAAVAAAAVTRIFEDDPGGVEQPPAPPGPGEGMARDPRGWRLRLPIRRE